MSSKAWRVSVVMIDIKPMDGCDWTWAGLYASGECPQPVAWHEPAERISAVLGPDGEPLRVGYERPKMGFDLTPRRNGGAA